MRPPLYVRHNRKTQGLRAVQRLFPAHGRMVCVARRTLRAAPGRGTAADPAVAQSRQRNGLLGYGHDPQRRLHHPARSVPSAQLVGVRAHERRHDHTLSRRHAVAAAGRAGGGQGARSRGPLRLRRRRRSPPSRGLRAAVRLPVAGSLGDDGNRRRRGGNRQCGAAPRRHQLLRPGRFVHAGPDCR